jgi:hypothetical protein
MLNWLDWILSGLNKIIRLIIYPFITPIFVIVNYVRAKDLAGWDNVWVKIFLVVSIIYLLLTIGFAILLVIKEWKKL